MINPNVYCSEWGLFPIPAQIEARLEFFDLTPKKWWSEFLRRKHQPALDVSPLPKNQEFWKWLNEQEIEAGKPRLKRIKDV